MTRLVAIWGFSVAMMSTFAVASTLPRKVFECSVNQTMNFSISIKQGKGEPVSYTHLTLPTINWV